MLVYLFSEIGQPTQFRRTSINCKFIAPQRSFRWQTCLGKHQAFSGHGPSLGDLKEDFCKRNEGRRILCVRGAFAYAILESLRPLLYIFILADRL